MKTHFLSLVGTFCLIVGHASAQVSYVREIELPSSVSNGLPLARGPINPSDPGYDPNRPEDLYHVDDRQFFHMFPDTDPVSFSGPSQFPPAIKLTETSLASWSRPSSSSALLYLTGPHATLYGFNGDTFMVNEVRSSIPGHTNSMAFDRLGRGTLMVGTVDNLMAATR